jgi:hypothetical protein
LARITDGALRNAQVIAGAITGYVQWCERLDRRFPFYWWQGREDESTRYAMQPRVAALFSMTDLQPTSSLDKHDAPEAGKANFWVYENYLRLLRLL